jgi:hypothetical protein
LRDIPALIALLEARSTNAFSWRGGGDCASFAAQAVDAQTGVDVRGPLRWSNKREARAVIAAEGGLEAAVDRRLERVSPALANRGDIAGVPCAQLGIRLMVVEGATLVAPGSHGAERQPRAAMTMAWDAMSARDWTDHV